MARTANSCERCSSPLSKRQRRRHPCATGSKPNSSVERSRSRPVCVTASTTALSDPTSTSMPLSRTSPPRCSASRSSGSPFPKPTISTTNWTASVPGSFDSTALYLLGHAAQETLGDPLHAAGEYVTDVAAVVPVQLPIPAFLQRDRGFAHRNPVVPRPDDEPAGRGGRGVDP